MAAAADHIIGSSKRSSSHYGLVYRAIDHKVLRGLCTTILQNANPPKYKPFLGQQGFGQDIVTFATAVLDLQKRRHEADYDPMVRLRTSDAKLAVKTARTAVKHLNMASSEEKSQFLRILLFPPRY